MKKIILLLFVVPLLFVSCEKGGDEPEPTPQDGVQLARTFENIGNVEWLMRSRTTQLFSDGKCIYSNTLETPDSQCGFVWGTYVYEYLSPNEAVYMHKLGRNWSTKGTAHWNGDKITWNPKTGRIQPHYNGGIAYGKFITSLTKDGIELTSSSDIVENKGRKLSAKLIVQYTKAKPLEIKSHSGQYYFEPVIMLGAYKLTVINKSSHKLKFVNKRTAENPLNPEVELAVGKTIVRYYTFGDDAFYSVFEKGLLYESSEPMAYMQIDDDKMLANEYNPIYYPVAHNDLKEYYIPYPILRTKTTAS